MTDDASVFSPASPGSSSNTFLSLRAPKRLSRLLSLSIAFSLLSTVLLLFYLTITPSGLAWHHRDPGTIVLTENSTVAEWPKFSTWLRESWTNAAKLNDNTSYLRGVQTYTVRGHDASQITTLIENQKTSFQTQDITAVIEIDRRDHVRTRLDLAMRQTHPLAGLWIVCPPSLHSYVASHVKRPGVNIVPLDSAASFSNGTVGSARWLQVVSDIQTPWIYIVDGHVSPDHLEFVYNVMRIDEYKDALIGTQATLLPSNLNHMDNNTEFVCLPHNDTTLPRVAQPVDMIHGAWLLRRSWLKYLRYDLEQDQLGSPLPYHISQSLLSHGNVPSIIVPHDDTLPAKDHASCKNVREQYLANPSWRRLLAKRTSPTALDQRQTTMMQDTLVFVAHGLDQVKALHPLMCRYTIPVHLAIIQPYGNIDGELVRKALSTTDCRQVTVHTILIDSHDEQLAAGKAASGIATLVHTLRPRILIHIRMQDAVSSFYHHLQAVASQYNISAIALPVEAVQHALWIPTLPFEAMEKWNTIRVNLVVITDRRPHSLSRLLQSTSRAQYLGDTVGLVINMEQSADRVTRMMVNSFGWRQGEKTVRHRILKGGLMPAIIESWYPQHDNDYAILLEDDIEVSPLFYVWTKYNILRYRYTNHPDAWRMFGISLYSPRNLELLPEGRRPFNPNSVIRPQFPTHTPYLSQVPCSWGAVYFPEHWREFHEYLTSRLEDMKEDGIGRLNITVPNSRSERWKKSWKKFIIQLVYLRGYVMLYPNFQQFESFSTNHLEFGTHIKKGRTKAALDGFTVPLMQRDTILSQLPSGELPNMDALPTLNLWGQRHTLQELEEIAIAWHPQVSACARTTERFNPQDLLCPFPGKSRKRKSPKKSSKPSKEVSVVQSIVIETVYVDPSNETTGPEVNGGADAETDEETEVWVPEPIDVAQLQTEEMEHALEDDQLHDLEADLAQLNSLQM